MARFCHKCGTSLLDIAQFCANCGVQVPIVPMQPQYQSPPIPSAPISQQPAPPIMSGQYQVQQGQPFQTASSSRESNASRIKGNGAYVAWFLFYFVFFSVITVGIAIPFFVVTTIIAFSKLAEKLWRSVSGVRPLRLKSEKDRLAPLFMEVYEKAVEADSNLSKGNQALHKRGYDNQCLCVWQRDAYYNQGQFRATRR